MKLKLQKKFEFPKELSLYIRGCFYEAKKKESSATAFLSSSSLSLRTFFCSNKPNRLTNKRELYWVHCVDHRSPGLALLCYCCLFGWPLGFLFSVEASRTYGRARPFFFFSTQFKHLLQRSFCCDMNFWCAFSSFFHIVVGSRNTGLTVFTCVSFPVFLEFKYYLEWGNLIWLYLGLKTVKFFKGELYLSVILLQYTVYLWFLQSWFWQ